MLSLGYISFETVFYDVAMWAAAATCGQYYKHIIANDDRLATI